MGNIMLARMDIIAMTTNSSIRVKPSGLWRGGGVRVGWRIGGACILYQGSRSSFFMRWRWSMVAEFSLHPFTEPLFDHALIVEIAGTCHPLDPGEHAGVHPQGNGNRLGSLA